MNLLTHLINMFWIIIEIKNMCSYIWIVKTAEDGIAFISNMKNVMMGDYYIMENIKKDINLNIKKNENFKVLINNYIIKEYYIFNHVNAIRSMNENEIKFFMKRLLLNFEIILIGSQKFIYEYVNYFNNLFNWYNNFKILIDKSIINSNIKEELYYNVSLELLSDIQNEHNKSLLWTVQNIKKLNKNIFMQIFKNYFKVFKENPYKISLELIYLFKDYSKINILSYGLNYDINVLTHNKHVFSILNTDILPLKSNSNKIIKNIDKEQHFILNNNSVWKPTLKKKDFDIVSKGKAFKSYMEKFITDRWYTSQKYVKRTYNYPTLKFLYNTDLYHGKSYGKLFNNKRFRIRKYLDYLKNSILMYSLGDLNLKIHIPYPIFIFSDKINLDNFPNNIFRMKRIVWDHILWHNPDYIFRSIQYFLQFFVPVRSHANPAYITEFVAGKSELWNAYTLSDLNNITEDNPLVDEYRDGALNLYRLRKLYGGYTNWWAWHQDASFFYKDKAYKILKKRFYNIQLPRKIKYYIIGWEPYFWKTAIVPSVKLDLPNFIENMPNYKIADFARRGMFMGSTELMDAIQEIEDMLAPDSPYNKMVERNKKALEEVGKPKKQLFMDTDITVENGDEIMYDMIIKNTQPKKEIPKITKKIIKAVENEQLKFNKVITRDSPEYKQAEELEKIRKQRDPLNLAPHRFPKVYKYDLLGQFPEITTIKEKKKGRGVLSQIEIKTLVADLFEKKGVKKMRKLGVTHENWGWRRKRLKRIKKWIVLHGNTSLILTKRYFKTFLVSNDIWIDVKFLKKSVLLEKFKLFQKNVRIDFKTSKIMTKHLSLKKYLGEFVNVRHLNKYNTIYRGVSKYLRWRFELQMNSFYSSRSTYNFYKKLYDQGDPYHGNIWDKNWRQEAENLRPSLDILHQMPHHALRLRFGPKFNMDNYVNDLNYIKNIKKFKFKDEDLLELTVKYNTPIKVKKVPQNWYKTVTRGTVKVKLDYLIPRKLFDNYFYPEVSKKLKKVGFKKPDLIFQLNMGKRDFILNKFQDDTKYHYNLKMKFDVYKNIIKRNFDAKYFNSKGMIEVSFNGVRGFLMYMFNFDVFANSDYLSTMHYIRKNSYTWDNFYYTNIESIVEPLNLNIIHKNFYGKHINKGFNSFLYKKYELVTDTILPKSRNVLLKKAYIKNLIYVYEKEDRPMINYILYILKREEIKIIHKFIINIIYVLGQDIYNFIIAASKFYKLCINFLLELIEQELLKFREARRLKNYIKQHPEYLTYFVIATICFIYVIICIFLILVIKTFLPKNLIYGKLFNKNVKNKVDLYNNSYNNSYNIENSENFIKIISELEDIMEIYFDKEQVHKDIKKEIKNIEISDITLDNLKKLELYMKLKRAQKLKINKNFFDPEHKYLYLWENKDFNLSAEIKKAKTLKKIVPLEDKRFLKKRVYVSKLEENKINDLKEKYIVFYKNFIFEKNLEKWESNTKRRLDFFFRKEGKGIIRLLLTDIWRSFLDRRYNHNRILFWNDPDLEDTSRINYMFAVYKPFFNIFFIIKFTLGSLKLWDYNFWISKWKQYVMFGVHTKMNYKDLRGRLEKEWSIEWFKDETDYGRIYFKDFIKVVKKYKNIKRSSLNQEVVYKNKQREHILDNIIELTDEEDKLKQISEYMTYLKSIEEDRIAGSFEEKFKNIAIKLLVDIDKIGPHKWAEQELRFKYRNQVYDKKVKLEEEEYEVLKKSYTSRVKRDVDDKERTLQTLHWRDDRKVKLIMKQKMDAIKYERSLREYNYHNKFVDAALDAKEKVFYESIKEYNEELSEEYLRIKEEKIKEQLEENAFERKSRKLFGILDENYIYFRWFTTMGARFNYMFVLITGIFVGWWDNIKRIRKNEYSLSSLFSIIKTDLLKYIYKIYWEYLIIWNQRKALRKLGFSIKEIFKFAIILTPIFFYSTFLYSIYLLYFILFIILYILPKKIYIKIEKHIINIIKKKFIKSIINIINVIFNYFVYIKKIISFLFKNIETGETLLTQIYNKFYKICGKVQYNIYMIKGAFTIGYTINNKKSIKNGLNSIMNFLKLKCTSYIEQKKDKKKFSKKKWINRINRFVDNTLFKIRIIIIITPIKNFYLKMRFKMNYYFYVKFVKGYLKFNKEEFIRIYKLNTELFKQYYKKIIDVFVESKNAKLKDLIILVIKTIWNLLLLPFVFIINHQKLKYIKNYKKGIQGFRDNPMRLIIDNPKKKKDWKVKLHNILMEKEMSFYLRELLDLNNTLIDIFFIFKIHEVKWTNKNYYQDYFWRNCYWIYKGLKKRVLNYLIDLTTKLEENYASFEETVETRNWSLWERFKYAYYTFRLYNHGMSRKTQKAKSRDLFFYKKGKDRRKIMRVYFMKGIVNWMTYITINKIMFTKIHDLKSKKTIYKYIKKKYKLKDIEAKIYINNNLHLTDQLRNTKPQFWSLIIMYDIYYKTLLRYKFEDKTYPTKWIESEELTSKKDYKWRITPPEHDFNIPFYERRFIAADINSYEFIDFVETLSTEPYDPLLRWIMFLLEYGMAKESLISESDIIWLEDSKEECVWGDISLTHLLTYNKKINEYRYEIKDFSRLMKGWDIFRVAENTLQRDKLKHYETRFKLISETILEENKDILEDILKERRKIRAKMLHKALARNRLKTQYELDQEKAKEQEREFYFTKKKEFFEELLIEEFWDWKADYEDGIVEDKYFNSNDIWKKTKDAHLFEEYFLYTRQRIELDYLLNHIVLKSFDQTMEEIHYFLTFKVWKILEKTLKENKSIIEINYKHLNISNEILSTINYDQHITIKTRWKQNKETKKEEPEYYYQYKYDKLEWESSRQEALYGFMETNILAEYFEAGEFYTYDLKIEYNEDALKFSKPPRPFHGQPYLKYWKGRVSKRDKTLKNIRKKSIKKRRKLPLNIGYINNIKWTWEQWLIYTDVEKENALLNRNTVVLNERFHLWNLKRMPMRVKLPVSLTADIIDVKNYIGEGSNYMSFMDHRHTMMLSDIAPMLKQGLIWEECKLMLEKRFNKNIQDLILWIFTTELWNRDKIKIQEDYRFVFKNFIQNYGIFHKLYFLGMPQYTWDLIRYHEAWLGTDEFPYHKYFQLKQIEFLNHDPAAKRIVRDLYKMYLEKYSPISFVFFFRTQYVAGYLYNIYGILSFSCLIWTLKVLMYNPGEYLSENYVLFTPMLLTLAFWFLRRSLKSIKDTKQGGEIYLYRHHTSTLMDKIEIANRKSRTEQRKQEWTEHFYDAEKIQELFPEGIQSIKTDLDPEWWRYHTSRNKSSAIYQYTHGVYWMFAYAAYFASEYWKNYKFQYRNSWWLWDYYRYDAEVVKELRAKGLIDNDTVIPQNYKEKQWFFDSWVRLENGGNWYSRWYENYYRKYWNLPKKALDYGYDWQKIMNVDTPIVIDRKIYHFAGGVADVNWVIFSRFVESYNRLPDEFKNFKQVIKFKPQWRRNPKKKRSRRRRILEQRWKREKYQQIFDDVPIRKFDRERELTNWEILRNNIIDIKNEFTTLFKKLYYLDRYVDKHHPLAKWGEFLFWVQDHTGFDTTGNIYVRFLLNAKKKTKELIKADFWRYRNQQDAEMQKIIDNVDVFKYMRLQNIKRAKELILIKSRCFYKGEKMDMRTLLSISDLEMHIANLHFSLFKNKQYRILKKLLKDKKYYLNDINLSKLKTKKNNLIWELKTYDIVSKLSYFDFIKKGIKKLSNWTVKKKKLEYYTFRLKKMKAIELNKKEYENTAKKLKRYYNYLQDIPKRIQMSERSEYRYNIMMNFFKEKKDFWIFVKDFVCDISVWDICTFTLKVIWKIFE